MGRVVSRSVTSRAKASSSRYAQRAVAAKDLLTIICYATLLGVNITIFPNIIF